MKKLITCLSFALAAVSVGYAAVTPLWMRDARISPDGSEIVFCYKGDIYKVSAQGGTAVQLTTQASYEANPVWSPDGEQIAFASDRNGNFDLFIMSADGGAARRLTYHSASEIPSTFTPDGKYVLFSASIQDPATSALFPTSAMTELYRVPVEGGNTEQVLGTPAEWVCFDKAGSNFLYQDRKGFEDEWRKHHTSSIARDIWLYDTQTGEHTNLTNRDGEDRNPVYAPDGKSVYFLSERNGGSFNVYSFPLNAPQQVKPVTTFRTHPVRFLSVSDKGTLCYAYDGELYTQLPNSRPQKVKVELVRDDDKDIASFRFSQGATSACVSPDGKQVAFIVRGDVFVTSTDYPTTKQITNTPAGESGLSFAPDNRTLVYASERTGNWQLYMAKITRKEDPNFPNATLIEEEVLLPSKTVERRYPQYSPDGKEIAFIEDRNRLMVLNLETKKVRQVTDGSTWYNTGGGFDYEWSPDGKWFTLEFIGNRHDPYSDIGIVSAQGGAITNLTNSGYMSGSPRWVLDGNAVLFQTERYGMRAHASWGSQQDVMLVFLNQDAYDRYRLSKEDFELLKEFEKEQKKAKEKDEKKKNEKKKDAGKDKKKDGDKDGDNGKSDKDKESKKEIVVELKGIEDRIVRLTPNSSDLGSAIVSKDGQNLYYFSAFEGGYDLWKMNLREKETKRLHKLNTGWVSLSMDKDGNIFLLGSRNMQKMDAKSDALKPISYQAEMKMDLAAEREAMFDHVYKQQQKRFYNLNMHGVNWDEMSAAYRKFLPHIDNNYDFAELLSEWLGELNVSHTGGRYFANGKGDVTSNLGLLFDWEYRGKGMRIAEVIEKGPFDHSRTKVKEGCIIEKINGQEISQENDITVLLNNKAGKKTLISLYDPQSKERWEEVVMPISGGRLNGLLYNRWVKQRAAEVEKWSNGRLGYVHIQSMGDGSFRTVYSDILGKYNNCEGIVIDTRFNGGGRLHEDIEILFSGQKYFTQVVRGREACDMPSRRWNKPSIMLQCEANYSNAHGTPWVYKYRNIGKLVGMPVPGTMTSVSWETLQDPSLVFGIPIVGYRLADGSYLENSQLEPDIKVANSPETVVKGEDIQLKAAVDELLKEIDSKKK
ncbi:S41 family peptidase [Bacteroides finegoldii]|jgi:mdsD protein|uniref:Tricorn protease homolog n=1 Tax=Bacteroides finegoldii TaxID=338188 RepID=A0A7J4YLM4_9BACE|nr:S41 family peptidase [Bacteroides finegoldii]EEX47304.1 WD40-like protein [Bacteroides finegoldii DSM 17565]KAA5217427.1 peptidase S41 [Bacteroides finegoldii]KAA5220179.1 peptidase S41 [Bacteroides finegoldii]KAA5224656.1 peptidase S41 [Bacteroides finegoldii]KAA5229207.1 peptidase S41 [Bacteroides finegoldii]